MSSQQASFSNIIQTSLISFFLVFTTSSFSNIIKTGLISFEEKMICDNLLICRILFFNFIHWYFMGRYAIPIITDYNKNMFSSTQVTTQLWVLYISLLSLTISCLVRGDINFSSFIWWTCRLWIGIGVMFLQFGYWLSFAESGTNRLLMNGYFDQLFSNILEQGYPVLDHDWLVDIKGSAGKKKTL